MNNIEFNTWKTWKKNQHDGKGLVFQIVRKRNILFYSTYLLQKKAIKKAQNPKTLNFFCTSGGNRTHTSEETGF